MGRDGALYELAQWYPRVNVYDDVRGWNTEPYLGQGEFYLEYGDFNLAVTVPAGYIVAGDRHARERRATCSRATEISATRAGREVGRRRSTSSPPTSSTSGAARPKTTGTLTWKFACEERARRRRGPPRPNYQWDASSWNGILAHALLSSQRRVQLERRGRQARMSIQEYSERWFQYPWPQITAVEGPISGMEYPMLAMENKSRDKYDLYNVVTHEIGHIGSR